MSQTSNQETFGQFHNGLQVEAHANHYEEDRNKETVANGIQLFPRLLLFMSG